MPAKQAISLLKMITLIFILFLVIVLIQIVWYSWYYGITPTPTTAKVKNRLIQLLPSTLDGRIVELGSGWGMLAFALAQHFSNCQIYAYEISPIPYFLSKLLAKGFASHNLQIIRKNFFYVSLEDVSLVVCYLYPEAMSSLKSKFEAELAPQTYVLSHTFAIPDWTPIRLDHADDLYHTPIYLYQIPQSFSY